MRSQSPRSKGRRGPRRPSGGAGKLGALGRGPLGKALTQLPARCRRGRGGRLRVDEPQQADVDELLAARVTDLDRDDPAPRAQLGQLGAEVEAEQAETRTTSEPRFASRPTRASVSRREVAPAPSSSGSSRSVVRSVVRPGRPCFGGSARRREPPNVTIPRRLPRRVAALPIARATPSATSAFGGRPFRTSWRARRRGRARSSCPPQRPGRARGSPVRAVAFQSMRRTSSPRRKGATGRVGPEPEGRRAVLAGDERVHAPPQGQVESAQERSGMGPGPGRAGVRTWAEPVMRRYPWRGRSREP